MISNKRRFALPAAVVGAAVLFGTVPAVAEEAFSDWGTVPAQELAEERGMAAPVDEEALALAIGHQEQHVIMTAGDILGDAGDNNWGSHTFAGQVMSANIFNTGHNNVLSVQNVVSVTYVSNGAP